MNLTHHVCQVNKIEVQYDKTSKQVDVQVLKEALWDQIKASPDEVWLSIHSCIFLCNY